MAETIHVRYTKWDTSLHWHFDASLLDRDEHGTWLLVPAGGEYRRGAEPARTDRHGFIVLIPRSEWWSAYFNAVPRSAHGHAIYVDINTSARWDGATVEMVDLDLDLTVSPDGRVEVIDEDEFLEHSVTLGYPPDVIDQTRAAAARLANEIRCGIEPFATAGFARVAQHLAWVSGTVVAGHGVASGIAGDSRFPNGTLAMQLPHFAKHGVPVDGLHHGTINIDLRFRFESIAPRHKIIDLEWKPGYPAETFTFFDACVAIEGKAYPAMIYRPDPKTKPEFKQPATILEVLATKIPTVEPGMTVSLWVDPTQGAFVTA